MAYNIVDKNVLSENYFTIVKNRKGKKEIQIKLSNDPYNAIYLKNDGLCADPAVSFTSIGPGRPDQIPTTRGIVLGTEENGTQYISVNSQTTGALFWIKSNNIWNIVVGDTGWRKIECPKLKQGYLKIRRINNEVRVSLGGGEKDTVEVHDFEPTLTTHFNHIDLATIPEGFRPSSTVASFLTHDHYVQLGFFVATSDSNQIQLRTDEKLEDGYKNYLRAGELSFITNDPWPDNFGGLSPV